MTQPSLGGAKPAESVQEYFQRWSTLHGGVDPRGSVLIKFWLTFAYVAARPLVAMRFTPNAVTMLGLVVAGLVPLCAWLSHDRGATWLWLAVVVSAISGLLDNLDGAVAIMTGKTSVWGYVLDSVADRFADALLLGALWIAGAPGWLIAIVIVLTFAQEYARARAAAAGMSEVGVVSIWERPTRIIVVAVFLGLSAWALYGRSSQDWASYAAMVALLLAVVGIAQVMLAIRKSLP